MVQEMLGVARPEDHESGFAQEDRLAYTHDDGEALAAHSRERRIRLTLEELGPTFIKLGQILSTRPDLVGNDLADELKVLQSAVPADPPETVRALIASELGNSVEAVFAAFDDVPLASASIGQVHAAVLPTGERVVVRSRS